MSSTAKPTKDERKVNARETAREMRLQQEKQAKRKSNIIKATIIGVALLIVAIIIAAVVINNNSSKPTEINRPANAVERGVIVGAGNEVLTEVPTKPLAKAEEAPAHMVVYQDYICPACKLFETSYSDEIDKVIEEGKAVIEYRTVTFLDAQSAGTNYSSRAANASYCVVNKNPEKFFAYNALLYANQPAEGTTGLTNKQLTELADSVGADGLGDCINSKIYRGWTDDNNKTSLEVPISGTPTVLINGEEWNKEGSLYDAVVEAGPATADDSATASPSATAEANDQP